MSDTFCKGCILEFESRLEAAKVLAFSVVLTNEAPGKEMRIATEKVICRVTSQAVPKNQLCANETGEVPIAWVDRGTAGTADAIIPMVARGAYGGERRALPVGP